MPKPSKSELLTQLQIANDRISDLETASLRATTLFTVMQVLGKPLALHDTFETIPDHSSNDEQEVYAVVAGSGTLRVDGEEVALRPGLFVYCSPEARRQMCAGAEGLTWIGIGATGADA